MKLPLSLLALFLLLCTRAPAQRPIEVADMQAWKEIENEQLAPNGAHVLYTLTPDVGDAEAVVYTVATQTERRFPRLQDARLSYDGRYLVGLVKPTRDTLLEYKRKDKGDQLKTMDTLLVWDLQSAEPIRYPGAQGFELSERSSDVYAYTTATLLPDSLSKGLEKDAKRLIVRRFNSQDSFYLEGVMEYHLARDQPIVVARRSAKDSTWTDGILRIDPSQLEWQNLSTGPANYAGLNLSYDGKHVAFMSSEKKKMLPSSPSTSITGRRVATRPTS